MLIEQYIKHVERYFWDRKQIQKVVDEEKEQRTARKGHTGGGGHAFISNPTETAALKNIEPVRMISFGYGPYQSIIMKLSQKPIRYMRISLLVKLCIKNMKKGSR